MDHRRDEAVPAPVGEETCRRSRAGIDDGDGRLVFPRPFRQRTMRGLHHGAGDRAGLAHDLDLEIGLDHPHFAEHGGDIAELGTRIGLVEIVAHDRRYVIALDPELLRPELLRPELLRIVSDDLAEDTAPAALAGILPHPDILDPGHFRHHLGFHQGRDDHRRLIGIDNQHRRPAELDAKIAPEAGQIGDGALIGEYRLGNAAIPHPALQFFRSFASLFQHPHHSGFSASVASRLKTHI